MQQQTVTEQQVHESSIDSSGTGGWLVIVYDNPTNTFPEVIGILQKATGCSREEAEMETWEVHNLGRSIVHSADRDECDRVAAIIATIGIRVEVAEL